MSKLPTHSDLDSVARIEVDANGLDFIIRNLPDNDMFTDTLKKLREQAKQVLWDREVGA